MAGLTRFRLLPECYSEVLRLDPGTSISRNFIRKLAISGSVRTVYSGNRRLIDLDDLLRVLNEVDGRATEPEEAIGTIRKVR